MVSQQLGQGPNRLNVPAHPQTLHYPHQQLAFDLPESGAQRRIHSRIGDRFQRISGHVR